MSELKVCGKWLVKEEWESKKYPSEKDKDAYIVTIYHQDRQSIEMEIEDVNDLLSRKLEGKTVRIDPYSYQEKKGTTNVFFSKVDFSNDGKSAKHKDNWKWKSDNNREKDEGLSIGEWRRFTDESLVVINWEKLTNWKDAYNKNDKRKDYGIYQILGWHRNLKDNSLLYIGKASEQTFGKQISEEEAWLKNACD
jgi:hypothetical protein